MGTLDDILKSYEAMAASQAQSRPLIDASDFDDTSRYFRAVAKRPGAVYLGALVSWLSAHGGLSEANLLQADDGASRLPSTFAQMTVGEQLWRHHVSDDFLPFVEAYVDTMLYANDYQDLVVGENGLVDMGGVDESTASFEKLWARITDRFEKFRSGNTEWNSEKPAEQVDLEPEERALPGWEAAFLQSIKLDGLPHRLREFRVGKFFSLVDHVHGMNDPAIIRTLLLSFVPDADPSLQESVLRALYSMPFETVLQAIIEDAPRLHDAGWLSEVLGLWANDYTDEQEDYFRLVYPTIPGASREAMRAAASVEGYTRAPWAAKLRNIGGYE